MKSSRGQMDLPIVTVKNVTYDYPGNRALDNVSVEFKRGKITAIVGPNGAGKSTIMRCIAALDQPFRGVIDVDGNDTRRDPRKIHKILGYLPDFFGLYEELTVEKALTFSARAHGIRGKDVRDYVDHAAQMVHLADRMQSLARELSRGLRQRLAIGQSIVHKPKLLILDEPASGLDPHARNQLAELFVSLAQNGMTLLVSSHILAELDEYADEMIIIEKGQIIGGKSCDEDFAPTQKIDIEITLAQPANAKQIQAIGEVSDVAHVESHGKSLRIEYLSSDLQKHHEILCALLKMGLKIAAFTPQKESLDSLYRKKIGK